MAQGIYRRIDGDDRIDNAVGCLGDEKHVAIDVAIDITLGGRRQPAMQDRRKPVIPEIRL